MKIQADSYNIIKDIGDRKSSSKNKNIKNNKKTEYSENKERLNK